MVQALVIDTRYGAHYGIQTDGDGNIVKAVEFDHQLADKFESDQKPRADWSWSEKAAEALRADLQTRESEFQLKVL